VVASKRRTQLVPVVSEQQRRWNVSEHDQLSEALAVGLGAVMPNMVWVQAATMAIRAMAANGCDSVDIATRAADIADLLEERYKQKVAREVADRVAVKLGEERS
jgi:hypothetical protein